MWLKIAKNDAKKGFSKAKFSSGQIFFKAKNFSNLDPKSLRFFLG